MTTILHDASKSHERARSVTFIAYDDDTARNELMRARSFVAVRQTARASRRVSVSDVATSERVDAVYASKRASAKAEIASYTKLSPNASKRTHDDDYTSQLVYCATCDETFDLSDVNEHACEHLRDVEQMFDAEEDALARLSEAVELLSNAIDSHDVRAITDARVNLSHALFYAQQVCSDYRTSVRGQLNRRMKKDRSNVCSTCNVQFASRVKTCFCDS